MRRPRGVLVAVGTPLLLLAVAVGAGAAGTVGLKASPVLGPELAISGPNATSSDYFPAVAWNQADDEYLVVWQDRRNLNNRGWDIYGRRVGADGAGPELRISGAGAIREDSHPAVAWNKTANEYLVVWMDYRRFSTRAADIYGRLVGADGEFLSADLRISGPKALGEDWFPAVAWNQTANEYLVVWEDLRNDSEHGHDIYGRRVGADGEFLSADLRISGPKATGNENHPAVAWNQVANQYLVVWQDDRNANRHYDIYGRLVKADGARLGGDIRISGPQAIGEEWEPAVACNQTAGEYLVVWGDFRDDLTGGSDIYGRRVDAAGARLGGDRLISGANNASWEERPAVAWNQTASEFLVVWQDWRNVSTSGANTYGRRLGAGGASIGGDFLISGPNTSNDYNPAVAWKQADNEYLVVWQDERKLATRGADIYGRRVTP